MVIQRFILLLALIALPSLSHAISISFKEPDTAAKTAIVQLPEKYSTTDIQSMWIKLAANEKPYLFILPADKCGASDCTIVGYKNTSKGWVKVYEVFGGDGLEILDRKTKKHNDIEQYESRGSGEYIVKTSKWNNGKYAEPVITKSDQRN